MNIRPEVFAATIVILLVAIILLTWYRIPLLRAREERRKYWDYGPSSALTNCEAKLSNVLLTRLSVLDRNMADNAAIDIVAALKIEGVVLCASVREISAVYKPSFPKSEIPDEEQSSA